MTSCERWSDALTMRRWSVGTTSLRPSTLPCQLSAVSTAASVGDLIMPSTLSNTTTVLPAISVALTFFSSSSSLAGHAISAAACPVVTIEQASTFGWERYAGITGTIIGMRTFGASAPLKALLTKFGFTPDRVAEAAREQVAKAKAK